MESWSCLLVENVAYRWFLGLGIVSLGFGFIAAGGTLRFLRKYLQLNKTEDSPALGIPAWLTGLIERLSFTTLVGLGYDAAIPIMVYIVVKIVVFWQTKYKKLPNLGERAGTSLVGTTLSLLFAMVGGMICKGRLCI